MVPPEPGSQEVVGAQVPPRVAEVEGTPGTLSLHAYRDQDQRGVEGRVRRLGARPGQEAHREEQGVGTRVLRADPCAVGDPAHPVVQVACGHRGLDPKDVRASLSAAGLSRGG